MAISLSHFSGIREAWRRVARSFSSGPEVGSRSLLPLSKQRAAFGCLLLLSVLTSGCAMSGPVQVSSPYISKNWEGIKPNNLSSQTPQLEFLRNVTSNHVGSALVEELKKAQVEVLIADRLNLKVGTKEADAFYDPAANALVLQKSQKKPDVFVHEAVHASQAAAGKQDIAAADKEGKITQAVQMRLAYEAGAYGIQTLFLIQQANEGDETAAKTLSENISNRSPLLGFVSSLAGLGEQNREAALQGNRLPPPEVLDKMMSAFLSSDDITNHLWGTVEGSLQRPGSDLTGLDFKPGDFSPDLVRRMTVGNLYGENVEFPLTQEALSALGRKIEGFVHDSFVQGKVAVNGLPVLSDAAKNQPGSSTPPPAP